MAKVTGLANKEGEGADGEEGERFGADRGNGADRYVHHNTLNVMRAKSRSLIGVILPY